MEQKKTHYRKVFNSPYISSADIVEPTVLTIKSVHQEIDKTKKTKDFFNTAYFIEKEIREGEPLKPLIINATNGKTMAGLTGSKFIEDWANTAITLYVDPSVRFGRDTVEGLRISTEKPRLQKPSLTPADTVKWARAIEVYKETKSFDTIEKHVTISEDNKILIHDSATVESDVA